MPRSPASYPWLPALMVPVLLGLATRARAAGLDGGAVSGALAALAPYWPWLAAAVLTGLAWLARCVGVYCKAHTHSARVALLCDALSSVAAGIALQLLQHPPAPADTLATVKQALVAQGVAYAKQNLPATIAKIGISDDTLAARLSNEVAARVLGSRNLAPMLVLSRPDTTGAAQPALAPALG